MKLRLFHASTTDEYGNRRETISGVLIGADADEESEEIAAIKAALVKYQTEPTLLVFEDRNVDVGWL